MNVIGEPIDERGEISKQFNFRWKFGLIYGLGIMILNYVVSTLLTHGLLDTPETYSNLKFEAQIHSDNDPHCSKMKSPPSTSLFA